MKNTDIPEYEIDGLIQTMRETGIKGLMKYTDVLVLNHMIERTKKFHPERYSGRKIGTTISPEKFLKRDKSQKIIKDLDNGYTIREIMEMRKCSPSTIDKVKRLRREVYETI